MKKSSYPCSQPDLYQICKLIALNCKSKMADFVLFSAVYSLLMIDAVLLAIEQAENLPGEEARSLDHELLRQQLIPINKEGLKLWQYLKRYIAKLYPNNPEMQRAAWSAAGWNHYNSNDAWTETKACLKMGSEYIKNNKTALLANNNMPENFETTYNEQMALFNETYTDFLLAEESSVEGTQAKITANNDIYDQTITICLDGQAIFEGNDAVKKQFSFEHVSQLIAPQGASDVKFKVTNATTGLPMGGVIISLNNSDKSPVTTNPEGDAEMIQLSSGEKTFTLTADGFTEKEVSATLTGTTKTIHTSMEPMFAGAMNVGSEAPSEQPAAN